MSGPKSPPHDAFVGVGFGLRWDFLDDLMTRLAAGELTDVPFLEVSPENYMRRGGYIPESLAFIADHVPLITHGLMMSVGGVDPFDPAYFEQLRGFTERFRTPWHSDHLCFSGVNGKIFHDLLPVPQTEEAARHVAARIVEARDRLGLPMAIENISYYLQLGHPDLEETEFLSRVLDEADCGLLLDVNNVFVNAQNHGFDPLAWLGRMDLSRVMQIHVAGHTYRPDDDLIIDTHGAPVADPVLELLTWTISRTGPVAVVLERDNDVPPLETLLEERDRVDAAYRRGLEAWHEVPHVREAPRGGAYTLERTREALRVLDHAVRTTDDDTLQADLAEGFPMLELDPVDADALRAAELKRVRVYRRLVRGNFVEAVENQLPRTVARLGRERYVSLISAFCEKELPRSQLLRDVPYEFTAWAGERLNVNDAKYLRDLARFELFEFDVYTADKPEAELAADELLADAPIAFDGSVRVATFDHAVHRLPDDPADRTVPEVAACGVLAYRDAEGDYRQLELTPLATDIFARLIVGETFAPAVQAACADRHVTLDASVIEGTSSVLADLAERGVVLGAAHARLDPRDPSPFFRWLIRGR